MPRPTPTPWILACDGTNPEHPWGFWCARCGEHQALQPVVQSIKPAWGGAFRSSSTWASLKNFAGNTPTAKRCTMPTKIDRPFKMALDRQSVCLLCQEHDANQCHRRHIAAMLVELTNVEVRDL